MSGCLQVSHVTNSVQLHTYNNEQKVNANVILSRRTVVLLLEDRNQTIVDIQMTSTLQT